MERIQQITSKLPDLSGVCFSSLCMVHCVVTPLAGPLLILCDMNDHTFHLIALSLGTPLSLWTVFRSIAKKTNWLVCGCLGIGWSLFIVFEFMHQHHSSYIQIVAGLLISCGHGVSLLRNRRQSEDCRTY